MNIARTSRAAFACAFAAALLAAGCCYWEEHRGETNEAPPDPLLSAMQLHYLDLSGEERRKLFRDPEFRTEMKSYGDKPRGVVERVPRGVKPKSPEAPPVGWSLRRADSDVVVDSGETADSFVVLSNLMAGTRYVLAFQTRTDGAGEPRGGAAAAEVRLRTSDRAPRLLDIPGIPNARDFGGWRGLGGRRIRQGLVIRSAGLNENATPKENPDTPGATRVTDATRAVLIGRLGVKTDIDLRWDWEVFGMTGSPLGPEVRWVRCPWSLYQWVAGDKEKAMFATIFRLLLDPANLPAVVHCIEGQDRTGTLCFLLQGLLGVSDEDKLRDWETTGFANPNTGFRHESRLDPFLKYLATLPGETVNERCVSYARSAGVTDEEIAAWRERMLEDAP